MGRQVVQAFQDEHDALSALLSDAERAGTSATEATHRVLAAVQARHIDWQDILAAALAAVATTSGARLIRQLRTQTTVDLPDYDPADPDGEVAALLAVSVPALAQGITDTTHSRLSDLFAELLAGGAIAALRDALSAQYDTWGGDDAAGDGGRAGVIGDSTTVLGWEAGAWDAAQQATSGTGGSTEVTRTWTAVGDAHTRPEHAEADGQQVGLHEPFNVGGEDLLYPSDPTGSAWNVIGCRCSCTYDIQGNAAGIDLSALEGE